MKDRLRVAVIGAGAFGRNHIRVLSQMPNVELTAVVDRDGDRGEAVAREYGSQALTDFEELPQVDAAVVATPTVTHEVVTEWLLGHGVDVLVEKPIADAAIVGERLTALAESCGRILQVGHLERFNPAVVRLREALTVPLFFEIHRLSMFTPRSLDVDVVLDLMIHDLDIVLSLTGEQPSEIRAAGISVLSPRVDIANVRLAFPSGCVANLTASRVSTEQVRKLRMFQPGEYFSVDYGRQETVRMRILPNELKTTSDENKGHSGFVPSISYEKLDVVHAEPLERELASFLQKVRTRSRPEVDGQAGTAALRVAEEILNDIREHAEQVQGTVRRYGKG